MMGVGHGALLLAHWAAVVAVVALLSITFHPLTKGRLVLIAFRATLVVSELAPVLALGWSAALAALYLWSPLSSNWLGKMGLLAHAGTVASLLHCVALACRARRAVATLPDAWSHTAATAAPLPGIVSPTLLSWTVPYPLIPSTVSRTRGIHYATTAEACNTPLRYKKYKVLDVYVDTGAPHPWTRMRSAHGHADHVDSAPGPRPVVLYIHGGGWNSGSKDLHGVTLCGHLAAAGFVVVNANYALHSRPTLHEGLAFPAHLVDVKRALRWIKTHIADYGGDPEFVVIAGGSAGGHLAAEAALTARNPRFQPGFEDVDLAVRGFVSYYGVLDVSNRTHLLDKGFHLFVKYSLMRVAKSKDPVVWDLASPYCNITEDAPPALLIHGDADNLVDLAFSESFAEEYVRITQRPCPVLVLDGAVHAFDVFPSIRALYSAIAVERFVLSLYGDKDSALSGSPPRTPTPKLNNAPTSPLSPATRAMRL